MTNPIMPLLGSVLSALLSPAEAALTKAESDPQGALSDLINLVPYYAADLPALEDGAISEGAQLGLTLIADLKAKMGVTTSPEPAPESPPST